MAHLNKFEQDYKIGYKDEKDNIVIKPIYDEGPDTWYLDNKYISVAKKKLCGVINELGEEIIPFEYGEIFHLFDNLFAARKNEENGEWNFGVLDANNNVIIPFEYKYIDHIGNHIECFKRANSERKHSYKLMDYKGLVYNYIKKEDSFLYSYKGKYLSHGKGIEFVFNYLIVEDNENKKRGVINNEGKLSIPTKYAEIHYANHERFIVRINNGEDWSFGVIDNNDRIIIDFKYKYIKSDYDDLRTKYFGAFFKCYLDSESCGSSKSASHPYHYYNSKDFVWCNNNGIEICDLEAKILSNDFLGVLYNGKWGVYNQSNQKIVNFLYDDVACVQNKIIVAKDKHIGILDENGRIIIPLSYLKIECAIIKEEINGENYYPKRYGQYSKKIKFDSYNNYSALFEKLFSFEAYKNKINISASEESFDFNCYFILSCSDYSEIFSLKNGILADSRFDKIKALTNISFAVKQNGKWGVYNAKDSKLIIVCEYERIFFEGKYVVLLQNNGLWGAKSISDSRLDLGVNIPIKYEEIEILNENENLYGVKTKRKNNNGEYIEEYTIVDSEDKILQKMEEHHNLDKQCQIFENNLNMILASKNNKYGFISAEGYISIPFIFDEVLYRKDGFFDVKIGASWGVIDIYGKEIVSIKYSKQIPLEFENLIVENSNSGRYGVLSNEGIEKVPSIYEHIKLENNYIFFGYKGEKDEHENFFSEIKDAIWGCMNNHGEIIIQPKYHCFKFIDNFILAGRDGEMLRINNYEYGYNYEGVYDLYSLEGDLIFGGFSAFINNKEQNIFAFFFGIVYDFEEEGRYYEEPMDFTFKSGFGKWLLLDKNLKTIIKDKNGKYHSFEKGYICDIKVKYTSKDEELEYSICDVKDRRFLFIFDNKELKYSIPNDLLIGGYWGFIDKNIILISDKSYGDDKRFAALDIHFNLKTGFHDSIRFISESIFFFSDKGKIGVSDFKQVMVEPEYLFLTYPVESYYFAAKEIDKLNSIVYLRSTVNPNIQIVAIQKINTDCLLYFTVIGELYIQFEDNKHELKDLILSRHDLFDESFNILVSENESNHYCEPLCFIYWYSIDKRFDWTKWNKDPGYDYDRPDYERDTWDALTDGQYGDYPGPGVDYDILG